MGPHQPSLPGGASDRPLTAPRNGFNRQCQRARRKAFSSEILVTRSRGFNSTCTGNAVPLFSHRKQAKVFYFHRHAHGTLQRTHAARKRAYIVPVSLVPVNSKFGPMAHAVLCW